MHSIVEEERASIAVEIHDELNASLIAARLESQRIAMLAGEMPDGPVKDEVLLRSQNITRLSQDLYASGRRLVRRLRPEVLDMLGLHGAVEEMLRQYNAGEGCHFTLHSEGDFTGLGNDLAISAYRVVQEALSNIMKHATAHSAEVSLVRADDRLDISIRDDGSGFSPERSGEGIGLIGMRERVAALNGTIEIQTSPRGTLIHITLPLPA